MLATMRSRLFAILMAVVLLLGGGVISNAYAEDSRITQGYNAGILSVHSSNTSLDASEMREYWGYGTWDTFRVLDSDNVVLLTSTDDWGSPILNVSNGDGLVVQTYEKTGGAWYNPTYEWRTKYTCTVKVYDTLTIKNSLPSAVEIRDIYRGETTSIAVDPQNGYTVAVGVEGGATTASTASPYVVSLNGDGSFVINYTAAGASKVVLGNVSGGVVTAGETVLDSATTEEVEAGESVNVNVAPAAGQYLTDVKVGDKLVLSDEPVLCVGAFAEDGTGSFNYTLTATSEATDYVVNAESKPVIVLKSDKTIAFDETWGVDQLKQEIFKLIDTDASAASLDSWEDISVQYWEQKALDWTEDWVELDGSSLAKFARAAGVQGVLGGEDLASEELKITYIYDKNNPQYPSATTSQIDVKVKRVTNIVASESATIDVADFDAMSVDAAAITTALGASVQENGATVTTPSVSIKDAQGNTAALPMTDEAYVGQTFTVTLSYDGASNYVASEPATAQVTLADARGDAVINATKYEFDATDLGNISLDAADIKAGANVSSLAFAADIEVAVVDSEGVPVAEITKIGTYKATFSFEGNGQYKAADDVTVDVVVNDARPETTIAASDTEIAVNAYNSISVSKDAVLGEIAAKVMTGENEVSDAVVAIELTKGGSVVDEITELGTYEAKLAFATNNTHIGSTATVKVSAVDSRDVTQINVDDAVKIPFAGIGSVTTEEVEAVFKSVAVVNGSVVTEDVDDVAIELSKVVDGSEVAVDNAAAIDEAGTYYASISYAGDIDNQPATVKVPFVVSDNRVETAVTYAAPAEDGVVELSYNGHTGASSINLSDLKIAIVTTSNSEGVSGANPVIAYSAEKEDMVEGETYTATVSYAGNDDYLSCSAIIKFRIVDSREAVSVSVSSGSAVIAAKDLGDIEVSKDEIVEAFNAAVDPAGAELVVSVEDAQGNAVALPIKALGEKYAVSFSPVENETFKATESVKVVLDVTDGRAAATVEAANGEVSASDLGAISISKEAILAAVNAKATDETAALSIEVTDASGEAVAVPIKALGTYSVVVKAEATDTHFAAESASVGLKVVDGRAATKVVGKQNVQMNYVGKQITSDEIIAATFDKVVSGGDEVAVESGDVQIAKSVGVPKLYKYRDGALIDTWIPVATGTIGGSSLDILEVAGNYRVVLVYGGNDKYLSSAETTIDFVVDDFRLDTTLTLSAGELDMPTLDTRFTEQQVLDAMSFTLVDENGVKLAVGADDVETAVTNSVNNVGGDVSTINKAGTYLVTVTYAANDSYKGSFNTLPVALTVNDTRIETTMSAEDVSVDASDIGAIEYDAEDVLAKIDPSVVANDETLNGAVVFVDSIVKEGGYTPLSTIEDLGNYTVTLSFAGDNFNKPCEAEVTFTVNDARVQPVLTLKQDQPVSYTVADPITEEEVFGAVFAGVTGVNSYAYDPANVILKDGSGNEVEAAEITSAGTYTITVVVPETNVTKKAEATATFMVNDGRNITKVNLVHDLNEEVVIAYDFVDGLSEAELTEALLESVVDTKTGEAITDYTVEFSAAAADMEIGKTYTMKVAFAGNDVQAPCSATVEFSVADMRLETSISLKADQTIAYTPTLSAEGIYALVFNGVADSEGNSVEVTYGVDGDISASVATEMNVGTHTVKVAYEGTATHKPSDASVTFEVIKGETNVNVDSQVVTYQPSGYNTNSFVSTDPEADLITFSVGLSAGENISGDLDAVVYVDIPHLVDLNSLPAVARPYIEGALDSLSGGATMTVSEFKAALEGLASGIDAANSALENIPFIDFAIDHDTIDLLISVLTQVEKLEGIGDLTVYVTTGGDGSDIVDSGVYLIGAVTADSNYNTNAGVGYFVITPDATKVDLAFNVEDENGFVTYATVQNGSYDLGAHVVQGDMTAAEHAAATDQLENIFIGVDMYGEPVIVDNQSELTLGGYVQMAYMVDFGNVMYYAEPIVRAFAVVTDWATLEFVGGESQQFVFTGEPQGMTATAADRAGNPLPSEYISYKYLGVEGDIEVYNSSEAPTHAGAYTVIATYLDPELNHAGIAVGTQLIVPAEASVEVSNLKHTYDGSTVDVADMVTVSPEDAKNVTIMAGMDVSGDFSENGLEAVRGVVNVDFPTRVDDVLKTVVPEAYEDGITLQTLVAELTEVKASLDELGMDSSYIDEIIALLNQMPNATTLTFKEQADVNPSSIGAYLVIGTVFDPDYQFAADMGVLVIAPEVTEATLEWDYVDSNGIFTTTMLQESPELMNATAYDAEGNALDATAQYLYVGVNADGAYVSTDSASKLDAGIYTQVAYIDDISAKMTLAEPIMRTIIVSPNVADVDFVDAEGENDERVFVYNGESKPMVAKAYDLSGTELTAGTMSYLYMGVESDAEGYLSTEAPASTGTYQVVATYLEYDAEGNLAYAGIDNGLLVILPAAATIDVDNAFHVYDGNAYDIGSMVASSPEDAKIAVITAGVNVAGDFSEEGLSAIAGTVNVDFPARVDEVLKVIVPDAYDEGINKDTVITDKLAAINDKLAELGYESDSLKSIIDALNSMPNVTNLTFKDQADANPSSIGTYLVIASVMDSDYVGLADMGVLVISPEVIAADLEWNYNDANGIITTPAMNAGIDFDASAYVNGELDESITSEIEYLVIGMNDEGIYLNTVKANELDNGVYTQIAYIYDEVSASMTTALPIMRTLTVVPQTVDVDFVDAEGENNERLFTHDGNPKSMDVKVTALNGSVIDRAENLTVTYTGITSGLEGYCSTEAPSAVGSYKVIAKYVEYDAAGNLMYFGGAAGVMVIERAAGDYALADATVAHDGTEKWVEVTNSNGLACEIFLVADEAGNVNLILPEECTWIGSADVYVADNIDALIADLQKVEAIVHSDCADQVIAEMVAVLDGIELQSVSVNGSKPSELGVYDVYAVAFGSTSYKPAADKAVLTITHDEVEIPAVEATCTDSGLTAGVKCGYCNEILVAQVDVPASGHDEGELAGAKPATPTEDGYTGDLVCTKCGELLEKGEIIPATGVPAVYFDVTFTEGEGYKIVANGLNEESKVKEGEGFSFAVNIESGYELVKVLVNGEEATAEEGVYAVSNVTENVTVEVEVKKTDTPNPEVFFNVNGFAENCDITFDGFTQNKVKQGEGFTFTVTAYDGYENPVVTVNDEALEAVEGVYTVENVQEDIVVKAVCSIKVYDVSFQGENCTFTNTGLTADGKAEHGSNFTFTVTAADGYELATVLVNGEEATAIEGVYAVENVTGPVVVEAQVKAAQQPIKCEWIRLAGEDRFGTMSAIAEEGFVSTGGTIIVANGLDYPDALAASGLAGIYDAPIVLTLANSLNADAKTQIERLKPSRVIIVGGEGVVSAKVEAEIKSVASSAANANVTVLRSAGQDRFETAADIYSDNIASWGDTAIVAAGLSFADALSISPYAYATKSPVFLTNGNGGNDGIGDDARLDDASIEAIKNGGFKRVVVVGGNSCVNETNLRNDLGQGFDYVFLAGDNRYETSQLIAEFVTSENVLSYDRMAVATGVDFPDALTGGALCGKNRAVLLLAGESVGALEVVENVIGANASSITYGYFLGGEGVVTNVMVEAVYACLGSDN